MNSVYFMKTSLMLFLFTTDPDFAATAEMSGVDSIIIDWENHNKKSRQLDYSTEINFDTPEDVARIASQVQIPVTVRINSLGLHTKFEIEEAIKNGAKIIMLPMASDAREVQEFIDLVDGRAKTIIQIETQRLVEDCDKLKFLPWDYAYIGLNDLMVSPRDNYIWNALLDGTVSHIYQTLANKDVGFGGVTVVTGGYPIPFIELLAEMSRLGCKLSFLRRSFKKDIQGRDMVAEIQAIRYAWQAACLRSESAILRDQNKLTETLLKHRVVDSKDIKMA